MAWFKYEEALLLINFNKDDLAKAKSIFDQKHGNMIARQIPIENVLKNKSNDYLSLESEFNQKYQVKLLSGSPLEDDFKFSKKVSVIIPSYNSGDALLGTLETLNNQSLSDSEFDLLEVVVVDDGSTDGTEDKIKREQYKFSLKYFKQENLGRSAARNKGIALSSGEIIIFLDSDVFLEKHLIREHAFRSEVMSNCVFVSFRENVRLNTQEVLSLLSDGVKPNIEKDFRFEKTVSLDWKRIHRAEQKVDARLVKLMEETDNFKQFGYGKILGVWDIPSTALTCSISMRKSDLLMIGGFSLEFKGWGMEDTFLGACVIANGNFIIPILSTGIYHIKHLERSGSQEIQLQEFNKNVEIYNRLIKNSLGDLY